MALVKPLHDGNSLLNNKGMNSFGQWEKNMDVRIGSFAL
jgi:hypothetical protein